MAVIYGTQGRDFLEGTGLDDIIQGWAKFGDQSTDLSDQLIGGAATMNSPAGTTATCSRAGAAATASSSVATMPPMRSPTLRMTSTRLSWTEPLCA
jgi:hypothetical protein